MSPRTARTSTRSTGRTQRSGLSRDAIVARATEVADAEGLDALTIRRIADEFSVTPMAMYWHFSNKDELLHAIGDSIVAQLPLPSPELTLSDFLREALEGIVATLRQHPGLTRLVPGRLVAGDHGRELTERALGALRSAGFDVEQSAEIAHNALNSMVMLVFGEPGLEVGEAPEDRDEVRRQKRALLLSLPADRYPHLVACADALTGCADPDDYFRNSIETFVVGVEAQRPSV